MCTSITLQSQQGEIFFGRTMDFSHDIQPELYIVPKNYVWNDALNLNLITNCYSFIGIGQELDGIMGFFDGVNEKGFAAAALYFAGYAQYNKLSPFLTTQPIASFDFLHYILGRCASIPDLRIVLSNISIIGMPDPITQTIAPLHWIAVDQAGQCIVIEQTRNGLRIFDNPIGVLTNSPDFPWHMTNLRNYTEVSPYQTEEITWENITLTPFGQAGGTTLLPGGYISPERFIRTAYLKTHIPTPKSDNEAIVSCFHIMESVSIPRGAVISARNTYDYTKYTAFINTKTCEYYFKTYDNLQIFKAGQFKKHKKLTQPLSLGKLTRPMFFENVT